MRRIVVLLGLLIVPTTVATVGPQVGSAVFADNGVIHGNGVGAVFADNGVIHGYGVGRSVVQSPGAPRRA